MSNLRAVGGRDARTINFCPLHAGAEFSEMLVGSNAIFGVRQVARPCYCISMFQKTGTGASSMPTRFLRINDG